jgi:hypothetical protein
MSVLQSESESRAVLDGRPRGRNPVCGRFGDTYDDLVAVLVEAEELRRLGEALLMSLAETQVSGELHDDRLR